MPRKIVERAETGPATPRKSRKKKQNTEEKPNKKKSTPKKGKEELQTNEEPKPQGKFRIDSDSEDGYSSLSENEENNKHGEDGVIARSNQKRDYFSFHAEKTKTSNNTLANLPVVDERSLEKVLGSREKAHKIEKEALVHKYEQDFPMWKFELNEGFNILLFGYGSKRKILNLFASQFLHQYLCIRINGFIPNLHFKNVLETITSDIFGCKDSFRSVVDHANFIAKAFQNAKEMAYRSLFIPKNLYFVINNIDGVALQSEQAQQALSILASAKQVHILASADHINTTSMWDSTMKIRFNWLMKDATSYEPYIAESKFEQPLMNGSGGEVVASGLRFLLQSLTPNARGIFKVLAEHQLANPKEGLAYRDFFQRCRDKFLVTNETTMRAQLSEFKDHKVIVSKKSTDGNCFVIPVGSAVLSQIVAEL